MRSLLATNGLLPKQQLPLEEHRLAGGFDRFPPQGRGNANGPDFPSLFQRHRGLRRVDDLRK